MIVKLWKVRIKTYYFGVIYKEKINHFEDDNGYDLFVPIKLKE